MSFRTILIIVVIIVLMGYGPQLWQGITGILGFFAGLGLTAILIIIALALLVRSPKK